MVMTSVRQYLVITFESRGLLPLSQKAVRTILFSQDSHP